MNWINRIKHCFGVQWVNLGVLLMVSCSRPVLVSLPTTPMERTWVFPSGMYLHKVNVEWDNKKQLFLSGILTIDSKHIEIVGLSTMGTTVFRVRQNRDDSKDSSLNMEIFEPALKDKQSFMLGYFTQTLPIFSLKKCTESDCHENTLDFQWKKWDSNGLPLILNCKQEALEWKIEFSHYDSQQIPRCITIHHPKFTTHIQVTKYEH